MAIRQRIVTMTGIAFIRLLLAYVLGVGFAPGRTNILGGGDCDEFGVGRVLNCLEMRDARGVGAAGVRAELGRGGVRTGMGWSWRGPLSRIVVNGNRCLTYCELSNRIAAFRSFLIGGRLGIPARKRGG